MNIGCSCREIIEMSADHGYCRQLQNISELHQRQQWLQSRTFTQHLGGAWWHCVILGGMGSIDDAMAGLLAFTREMIMR